MQSFIHVLINSLKHFWSNPFFINFSIFRIWGFAPIRFLLHVGGYCFSHVEILREKSQDATKSATDKYFSFRVLTSDIFYRKPQILKLKKNVGGEISKMGTPVCRGFGRVLRSVPKTCLIWSKKVCYMQFVSYIGKTNPYLNFWN